MKIRGGKIYRNNRLEENKEWIVAGEDERILELREEVILPSFADVHVHFREPGQSYKETIRTGSLAAAHGGYTAVCSMPNLNPPPHDLPSLRCQTELIERDALIHVYPYGSITENQSGRGRLSDMEAMADQVIAFSDDGKGMQDDGEMRAAMETAKALGKLIVAHCEDESLLREGRIRESEWRQIERDLKLADETGCGYHVCHISCVESVQVIRDAKKSGVDVTAETAPHYLLLDEEAVQEGISRAPEAGGRFKMNPPIKGRKDREALIQGLIDGTVDMIATDHAPHSAEEKSRGFEKSLNGITGLECAFPVLYTGLVERGVLDFTRLMELMAYAPRVRFGIQESEHYAVMDLKQAYRIDAAGFLSMGKCTPFDGWMVRGRTVATISEGRLVYEA